MFLFGTRRENGFSKNVTFSDTQNLIAKYNFKLSVQIPPFFCCPHEVLNLFANKRPTRTMETPTRYLGGEDQDRVLQTKESSGNGDNDGTIEPSATIKEDTGRKRESPAVQQNSDDEDPKEIVGGEGQLTRNVGEEPSGKDPKKESQVDDEQKDECCSSGEDISLTFPQKVGFFHTTSQGVL